MPYSSSAVFILIEQIAATATVQAAWDLYCAAARDMGLLYGLAFFASSKETLPPRVVGNAMPPGWVETYAAQDYQSVDPLSQRLLTATTPFAFDLADWRDDPSPQRRAWHDFNQEAGVEVGFAVPDRSGGDHKVLCVVGPRIEIHPYDAMTLHFAGIATLQRMHELGVHRKMPEELSAREAECLTWAAVGKSDWEIGSILGLSDKTVNTYMERAKQKLSANTRAQAIVVAYRNGAIKL